MGKRFVSLRGSHGDHVQLKTRYVSRQAQQYVCGLIQTERKNMERMEEAVPTIPTLLILGVQTIRRPCHGSE